LPNEATLHSLSSLYVVMNIADAKFAPSYECLCENCAGHIFH